MPAVLDAAKDADLLVLGSRGVTGLRALRSVSERAAHHAPCPLLVVRGLLASVEDQRPNPAART